MKISTALKKIKTLNEAELSHFVSLMDIEIFNCKRCIKNYSEKNMQNYGIPHLNRLNDNRSQFQNRLMELQQGC